jgi:hypothetical protein
MNGNNMSRHWLETWLAPELLKTYNLPSGSVDFANENLDLTFSQWSRDKLSHGSVGTLDLKRQHLNKESSRIDVEWRCHQRANKQSKMAGEQIQKARMTCRKDELVSPVEWELESYCTRKGSEALPYTRLRETATVLPGRIEIGASGRLSPRMVPFSGNLTSNWSLMYAVSQMWNKQGKAMEFNLFQDLSFLYCGMHLSAEGTYDFPLGDQTVPLHGFKMLGSGIQPTFFWVDDGGRPIFVTTSPVFTFYLTGMKQEVQA